ncbi:MAG TPA: cytochrome c biogenesis protein ResB [Candidatus Melainabacteria bacterium]|nr:cytochrome c biogenesis protein ResB [Candidatus Melainabacteria bacterium]
MKLSKSSSVSGYIGSCLSSVRLTLVLIAILVVLSIVGACVPQISQGESRLLSDYSSNQSLSIVQALGFTDVFGSWPFLLCIAGLFVNLIACTIARMPERIRRRLNQDDHLASSQVAKLRQSVSFGLPCRTTGVLEYLHGYMEARGYKVSIRGNSAVFRKGKAGWLAAPLTHLGLVVLLLGVMISMLFSYSGVLYLKEGDIECISGSLEQKGPLAHVPELSVKLLSTKSESYAGGEPKQWFSTLAIANTAKQLFSGSLSVNSPLTFDGIDFCQSDWKIAAIAFSVNSRYVKVPLSDMPHGRMGVLRLSDDLALICAYAGGPHIRVYLKEQGATHPRFLANLAPGQKISNFPISILYEKELPQSGIKFKSDPGLWVTYTALLFFFLGSILVAVPDLKIWAAVDPGEGDASQCWLGFSGVKSARIMRDHLRRIEQAMKSQFYEDKPERGVVMSNER